MKQCIQCGAKMEDDAKFCGACGASELTDGAVPAEEAAQTPAEPRTQAALAPETEVAPAPEAASIPEEQEKGNGNVVAGIVGALLFSLIGAALYFAIYQLGVIAGICGLAIFLLANFGYRLFARTKNKSSIAALVVSIVAMAVMIFAAQYFCLSFEIYQAFGQWGGITILDALQATPEFLAYPDVASVFWSDLAFAYVFGFAASIGNILAIVKARKDEKQRAQSAMAPDEQPAQESGEEQ